ncbi:hypothetical protein [Aquimarina megaterium]|uniref:hypothetical protein n=1 Tax=Aquimarina megaterium TaxID=1443666 RepID=UPI000470C5C5|nr:hypothetical protein [Aquimarina megaterium]
MIYKRHVLIFAVLVLAINTTQSQEFSRHTLGVRPEFLISNHDNYNDPNIAGIGISYQLRINSKNRLEFDTGLRVYRSEFIPTVGLMATGIYQRVFPIYNNFNWYLGIGGGALFNANLGIIADGGIEYSPNKSPIQISLNIRPEIFFSTDNKSTDSTYFYTGFGLGIRYQF